MVGLNEEVVKEWSEPLSRCSRPCPCQVLFIFMRGKFVCFRVVCLYFVDVTEERGGMVYWEAHACPGVMLWSEIFVHLQANSVQA